MKQTVKELCVLPGASGRESAVREYILKVLHSTNTEKDITVDRLGNVICVLKGRQSPAQRVMFCAHMDEVALIITHITDDGYLRFATVGGIEPAVLCGRRVKIGDATGVIGCKAVHLCDKEEAKKQPKVDTLMIDIGVNTAAQAKELVKQGDIAVFDADFVEMQDLIMAKALDDRAGCALLLELAKETPPYDITLVFTVQEEVGARGAATATFAVTPDIAVIVETTTAADIADVVGDKRVCGVGDGPVVSFMDKGTVYDHELYTAIRALADEKGIPNQTKRVVAGGNDAKNVQRTATGVRVAAVSLPCRYLHSASCVLSFEDMQHTFALLKELTGVLPK